MAKWKHLALITVICLMYPSCGSGTGTRTHGERPVSVVDVDKYLADSALLESPLQPSWSPPGGQSLSDYTRRYGFSESVFGEMKQLVKEILMDQNVPEADAANNNGRLGDMILETNQLIAIRDHNHAIRDKNGGRKKRSLQLDFDTFPSNKWPAGVPIKYHFDGSHGTTGKNLIREAFQFWADTTCLTFEEAVTAPTTGHYAIITGNAGCYSDVGKVTVNPQTINLNPISCVVDGTILHEIGHTLGKFHEHTRPDRDTYVSIDMANVQSGATANYVMVSDLQSDVQSSPYDYNSVMHYSWKSFAVDTNIPVIVPLGQDNKMFSIGQRTRPTFWDVRGVNLAYCEGVCTTQLPCAHNGYTDPTDCTRCVCPEGLGGTLCNTVATGGMACHPSSHGVLDVSLTGAADTITSPGWIDFEVYPQGRGKICNFIIRAPVSCHVSIAFDYGPYVLGTTADACIHWVEIKYKADLALPGPMFCLEKNPKSILGVDWLISESNEMVVIFSAEAPILPSSNFPNPALYREGFQLSYKITDPLCLCSTITCNNGGVCTATAAGPVCTCTPGFTGPSCAYDVNECLVNNGGCEQTCVNDAGSYHCTCESGYTLTTDNHGCDGCGPNTATTWSSWTFCTMPCGGCGIQRRKRCDTGTSQSVYEHRRCNICPCRRGIDRRTFHLVKISRTTLRRLFLVHPMQCCNDFLGVAVRPPYRPVKPRECYRRKVKGWYPGPYNRGAFCRVSAPTAGYGAHSWWDKSLVQVIPPYL